MTEEKMEPLKGKTELADEPFVYLSDVRVAANWLKYNIGKHFAIMAQLSESDGDKVDLPISDLTRATIEIGKSIMVNLFAEMKKSIIEIVDEAFEDAVK